MSSAPAPPPPPPSPNPDAPAPPPRVVRAPPQRRAPGPRPWAERRPAVSVDLDRGRRVARTEVDGVRAASLPARHRLSVEGTRWQRDWKVSEAAARVLALPRDDARAVDAVLNCWAGRLARRNFPLLIREITISGSLKHAVHVFRWMKNQENYRARTDIYGMMIRLHARHNQVDQARGLFFEMQEWRCKPDADTYNSLIHVHARAGQWRWAINIMENMQRAAGKLTEAEYTFSSMKESGCFPDVLTYTAMIKAYSDDVRFLLLCNRLREWKIASEIIEHLDSSLSTISVGTLNHLLNFLGKCGKTESMMKLFYKMVTSCSTVGLSTYTVLLRNLLIVGKWRKYIEVLQWMEDAGVRPTLYMYQSVLPYIWRDNGMDYVILMQEKISMTLL
nr:unnamed protein product [Digitaria exilis]